MISLYEKIPNGWLRKAALDAALQQIRYEDTNTKFLDIGPVSNHIYLICLV